MTYHPASDGDKVNVFVLLDQTRKALIHPAQVVHCSVQRAGGLDSRVDIGNQSALRFCSASISDARLARLEHLQPQGQQHESQCEYNNKLGLNAEFP